MLDKQLCAAFGIDEFNQWIMKQLDYIEDQLYESEISSPRYIELKSKYHAFKAVRDAYCKFNQKELLKEKAPISAPEAPVHEFEVIIFDQQDDPSRFYKLTHHFEWICPLDRFPDVTVSDVNVDLCICPTGYKVTVNGYISGEHAQQALAAIDLEGWGSASLVAVLLTTPTP